MLLVSVFNVNAQVRTLDFYLKAAKINSPLINKSENETKIAQLDLAQLKSRLSKPLISLESSVLFAPIIAHDNSSGRFKWISNGANDYSGYDQAVTDGGQYQAVIAVTQPLFNKTKLQTYSSKTELTKKIDNNAIVLTIHELRQLVTRQYILCLRSEMQKQNKVALLKEMNEQLGIMQKLVEGGIYKQADLILMQIAAQNYQIEIETFQSEYQSSLSDLNLLCGINDTTMVDLQKISLQTAPAIITRSKFITAYKLDSLNLISGQKISELNYKPQINWVTNAGLNAVYRPSLNRIGFSTGLTFSYPLFDGNQRKIQREKTAVHLTAIEFEKQKFLTQTAIEKNKIISQIHFLDQRINRTNDQLKKYDQLLGIYSRELSRGELSVIDYKNVFRDIASKQQENILLKTEKQLLINSYQYWNY